MGIRLPHDQVPALAEEFARFHTFKIERFIEGELLEKMEAAVKDSTYLPRTDKGIGHELCMEENLAVHTLRLMLNDASVFEFIERATGCEHVQCFHGRMYKMLPGGEYFDSWHDDSDGQRMVGMSINFSPKPYAGGTFEIKELEPERYIRKMPNLNVGDAIFFRIADNLKHQVSKMKGTEPKVAFAGWFQNAPNFIELLRKYSQEIAAQ